MKTTTLKLCMVLLVLPLISSCSKDDDSGPSYSEENYLDGYLSSTGLNQENEDFINSGTYEFGTEFTPLVKGKIKALKVKLPDVNNSLRITIWNLETSSIVKTEIVNVSTANMVFTFDIVDLTLVKDNRYAITMNSNDWYNRKRTDGAGIAYPVTVGNMQIDGYKWASGTAQTYPTNVGSDYYAGDLSFDFIQVE